MKKSLRKKLLYWKNYNFVNFLYIFYLLIFLFIYLFVPFHRIPCLVVTDSFSVPPYHYLRALRYKLPNCRCVRRLPRTRGNCGKPVSVQTTIYFSDSSMPAIKESGEQASRSMADVQVSARLNGHPSKYWLRAALLDFGDSRSRAPIAL